MVWTVERAATVGADLEAIYDHLLASMLAFGEPVDRAHAKCAARIDQIESDIDSLANVPHQGVRDPALSPNLRHVTKDRAILYFELHDARKVVYVLAIFYGGQDHMRQMLIRMLR